MEENFVTKEFIKPLSGDIVIPADKSISHRSLIIGVLTKGKLKVENFLTSADCLATLNIIKKLGAEVNFVDDKTIEIDAANCFKKPDTELDCQNSGTSMRLLAGILAGCNFKSTLTGDLSLSKRPMGRIIEPLTLMGAKINSNENKAPLEFLPSELHTIEYKSKIASAQVKSCILLAGLNAKGPETAVIEPYLSRNHTEKMLEYFGADIRTQKIEEGFKISLEKSVLEPKNIVVAGDISSAAFFMAAALTVPGSDIIIRNVGVNETRSGIIDVLLEMNADIEILDKKLLSNEYVADIRVKYSENLRPVEIKGEIIPRLIDEIPVLAVLMSQANGQSRVSDAQDLRNKESDRIRSLVQELSKIGVNIKETADGFTVEGKTLLSGDCELEAHHDHRLAMSFFVAGLIARKTFLIKGFRWVETSFPNFLQLMYKIGYN